MVVLPVPDAAAVVHVVVFPRPFPASLCLLLLLLLLLGQLPTWDLAPSLTCGAQFLFLLHLLCGASCGGGGGEEESTARYQVIGGRGETNNHLASIPERGRRGTRQKKRYVTRRRRGSSGKEHRAHEMGHVQLPAHGNKVWANLVLLHLKCTAHCMLLVELSPGVSSCCKSGNNLWLNFGPLDRVSPF